ncbi:MAG: alpha/beta hydrolase [Parvibaculaceae bacterium]|nr:alpha/beta hydrolase [Parvibaculaceae bacterium]
MKRIALTVLVIILVAIAGFAFMAYRPDLTREELMARYTTPASQFITLPDGATAHVRDEGNKSGPALVLVHGSNASLQTWEPWVKLLGGRFRVVSLDLPGHGLTGAVPNGDYSREGMAAFVHEVTQKLGLMHYAIAGNSMGGGIAALYAELYPAELTSLILVDAAGLPRTLGAPEKLPLAFTLARTPVLRTLMRWSMSHRIIEEGVRKAFSDQSKVTPEMIGRYEDLNQCCGNRAATVIRFSRAENDSLLEARLDEIRVPTLILWGDRDGLIPVAYAHEYARLITGAKLIIYPGVGHIPMEEIAEQSAGDVRSFLEAAVAPANPVPVTPVTTQP